MPKFVGSHEHTFWDDEAVGSSTNSAWADLEAELTEFEVTADGATTVFITTEANLIAAQLVFSITGTLKVLVPLGSLPGGRRVRLFNLTARTITAIARETRSGIG